MSKTILISYAAVACWLAAAAPQVANDAPGVTVSLNGATVMHRTGVNYPPAALQARVQGMVSVEVKLDSAGEVNDAQVLSGPDELRKAALESVLQWHFTHDMAGTARTVQIAFELPKPVESAPAPNFSTTGLGTVIRSQLLTPTGRIKSIVVSDQVSPELLANLPVHEGDEWNADTMAKVNQALKALDEHLTIQTQGVVQGPSGEAEISLRVALSNALAAAPLPARAAATGLPKVGGSVMASRIVTKVPPVYPALAKQARVSGVVQLAAVVGKDGTVQELHSLGGPALLIQAAMDAVKQWVYQPFLLNGAPAAVETTIDINFTLNQ